MYPDDGLMPKAKTLSIDLDIYPNLYPYAQPGEFPGL